jgi:hypothetical protein
MKSIVILGIEHLGDSWDTGYKGLIIGTLLFALILYSILCFITYTGFVIFTKSKNNINRRAVFLYPLILTAVSILILYMVFF